MEELFKNWTLHLSVAIEVCAGLIVGIAALEATVRAVSIFVRRQEPEERKEQVRLKMGRWLALALEFELAADILRTAVAPSWDEIGKLAAIVVLRTVLNFFLQKEIDLSKSRSDDHRPRNLAA